MVETSKLIREQVALLDPAMLVFAASKSGRTAEIAELLKLVRHRQPLSIAHKSAPAAA
jgi:DNA-binding MurR/RpiR family transcriptional regulator